MGRKRFAVGLLVAAVFLVLLFYKTDFAEMGRVLSQANYWYLVPAIGIYFVSLVFRTLRWHYLMRPIKPVSYSRLFSLVSIGYMANNLLPARGGELVRAYILGEREQISKTSILATIAMERIFDGLALLTFAALMLPWIPLAPWLQEVLRFAGAIFVGGLLVLILMSTRHGAVLRLAEPLLRRLPPRMAAKSHRLLDLFLDGIGILRSPRGALVVFGLSILSWLAEASMYYLVMFCFDIRQGLASTLLMTTTANLATSVPSSQGGIGPFEFFAARTLSLFGVEAELANVYSLVLHITLLVPVTLMGLVFLWRENLSLAKLSLERRAMDVEQVA